jgi:DNA-binding winged helix-turn-helix (wHTH) protein/tetratricopeptide (TPR) repeat protein
MSNMRFGQFTLDTRKRLLLNRGEPVSLGPKVIETLVVLVENAGVLVTKSDLMERLWPNEFVQESNLTQNIYRLRKVLERGGLGDAIETMPWRGYRFTASIATVRVETRAASATSPGRARWFAGFAALLLLMAPLSQPSTGAFAALSPESRRLYALGRYHWNQRFDRAQIAKSLEYFNAVAKRDPRNPLGYAGMTDAYLAFVDSYCALLLTNCRGAAKLALANARRAVELGPRSAEARTSYAMTLYMLSRDYAASDAQFKSAIALNDEYALAHYWYGISLAARSMWAQAAIQYRRAIELEPASPGVYAWFALDQYSSGRYRSAIASARESVAITPHWRLSWIVLGLALERLGEPHAAIAAFAHLPPDLRDALTNELRARRAST